MAMKQLCVRVPEQVVQDLEALAADPKPEFARRSTVKVMTLHREALLIGIEMLKKEQRDRQRLREAS